MKPFIHKFRTEKQNYIYDVNSNRVFSVGDLTFRIIDEDLNDPLKIKDRYPQFSMEEIVKGIGEISEAKKKGFFSSSRPCKIVFHRDLPVEVLCDSVRHEQLILNVTERCNLRCKYCTYSGNYYGQRTHSERDMSFETAKGAIKKFLNKSTNKFCLSFYGGEPLLNFKLIESIISFIHEQSTREIILAMTTNGTLLTPEKCNYLAGNGFLLNISLDGPKHIHDRYRVYKNGTGTYDSVIQNLEFMKANYPEYYKKNVTFSVVNTPPYHLKEIEVFFRENPLLKSNEINFNNMNNKIDKFCYNTANEDYLKYFEDLNELSKVFFNLIASGKDQSNLMKSVFYRDFIRFYHRPKTDLSCILRPNGCCIPGSRRIFVSIDGTLHVCEKMDNCCQIGDVETWIDLPRVKKLCDEYINQSHDCLSCWACRLCMKCFSNFIRNSFLDKETASISSECRSTRDHLHKVLMGYFDIYEQNKYALDFLEHMKLE
jgi:uncharacterized protein